MEILYYCWSENRTGPSFLVVKQSRKSENLDTHEEKTPFILKSLQLDETPVKRRPDQCRLSRGLDKNLAWTGSKKSRGEIVAACIAGASPLFCRLCSSQNPQHSF